MSNFPSKWFEFTNSKEIKRMRSDINDTFILKIEISASIIITIVAAFFSEYIRCMTVWGKIFCCVIMSIIILLIFFLPSIIKHFSIRRHCNLIIKGKDAVAIFDDEIVYNVLVAAEYSNSIKEIPDNKIKDELINFYRIEIEYYITIAIDQVTEFNTNYQKIVGNKKNQISLNRMQNIFNLIDSIIIENRLKFSKEKMKFYEEFKKQIENLKRR